MPRFLLFSDLHFNTRFKGLSITDQLECVQWMINYAKENNIKNILFSGDWYHSHGKLDTEVVWTSNIVFENLRKENIKLIAITGNHDHARNNAEINALWSISACGSLLDLEKVVEVDGIPIAGIPYLDDTRLDERLKEQLPNNCILLLHQGVRDVAVNSKGFVLNEALSPEMVPDNVLHTFVGHYHTFKKVTPKFTIPGALMQHTWQDSVDSRGFLDIIIKDNNIQITQITNPIFNKFKVLTYEEYENYQDSLAGLNVKVTNIPDVSAGSLIKQEFDSIFNSLVLEYKTPDAASPDVIQSTHFSTADFFEEYVQARNLDEKYIKVGREIVYGT